MDISIFVSYFKSISYMEWIVIILSAIFIVVSFGLNPKFKCVFGIVASIIYGCIFLFVINKTFILNMQIGWLVLVVVNILMILTAFLTQRSLVAGIVICLTQFAVYIPTAAILWMFYTLADSIYKDDIYLPDPYYLIMQFVIFATSLVYQIILLKDFTSGKKETSLEQLADNVGNEDTSLTNNYSTTSSSNYAQVDAHGEFLEKQLSGTLTSAERDEYDRKWS